MEFVVFRKYFSNKIFMYVNTYACPGKPELYRGRNIFKNFAVFLPEFRRFSKHDNDLVFDYVLTFLIEFSGVLMPTPASGSLSCMLARQLCLEGSKSPDQVPTRLGISSREWGDLCRLYFGYYLYIQNLFFFSTITRTIW